MIVSERIKNLVAELNRYRDSYYNDSVSLVSDYEYDKKFDNLKQLEYETGIIMSNSPTQNVGYEVKTCLNKVTHNHPMLSLDKTKSIDDLAKFLNNHIGIAMLKMDGLTISLRYVNGNLVSAETRGNGDIGEDIFHNAKTFVNIPLKIDYKEELIVDGEAIITYDDFEKINDKLPEDEKYKNVRNLASGSVRQLDSSITKSRNVRFVAWKLINGSDDNNFDSRLSIINSLGFDVVPYKVINDKDKIENIIDELKEIANDMKYPIDGIVVGYNDVKYGESLGNTNHHPRNQIAFKFYDDEVETILKNIEYDVGKSGMLTPVAVFNPVEIDGTTVERASLHNLSIMKSLELSYGDTIIVYKANQVIPQVKDNVDRSLRNICKVPTKCPKCGEEVEITKDNNTEFLICTNGKCKGKLLKKLSHYVSVNAMNINGLSEATLNKFIENGWINSYIDLYYLIDKHYQELINMDGFGKRSIDRLKKSIEQSKNTTLDRFIYALSIPLVGRTASKTISKYFNGDFDKFISENRPGVCFDWLQLENFGNSIHDEIQMYINNNREMIIELASLLNFNAEENKNNEYDSEISRKLFGKTFVITGSLYRFSNRNELVDKIESMGGKVSGSISKKIDYLINNDINSNSSKNKKAKELGVPIITEEELINKFL